MYNTLYYINFEEYSGKENLSQVIDGENPFSKDGTGKRIIKNTTQKIYFSLSNSPNYNGPLNFFVFIVHKNFCETLAQNCNSQAVNSHAYVGSNKFLFIFIFLCEVFESN